MIHADDATQHSGRSLAQTFPLNNPSIPMKRPPSSSRTASTSLRVASSRSLNASNRASSVNRNVANTTQSDYVRDSAGKPIYASGGLRAATITKVFVKSLPFSATERHIESHFSQVPGFRTCELHVASDNRSRGTAIVEYETSNQAQEAVRAFDGKVFLNRTITVTLELQGMSLASTRASVPSEPLIANGSTSRSTRRA